MRHRGAWTAGCVMAALVLAGCMPDAAPQAPSFAAVSPAAPAGASSAWTEATARALNAEGVTLVDTVPEDIAAFCPGYASAPKAQRRQFWAGLFARIGQVGGAGRAAAPAECAGGGVDGMALCTVRAMASHVARDGAIAGQAVAGQATGGQGGWLGLARSWLPLRNQSTRNDIAGWTARQPYCG